MSHGTADHPLDLLGVGAGPFNLSLAALADGVPRLRSAFFEQSPAFRWHPGLLIDGTTLQVPFLADLVSLVEPRSPYSFLNYLRSQGRLFPFYFAERFHIRRAEYDHYCRWASERLPSVRFGRRIERIGWDGEAAAFHIDYTELDAAGPTGRRGRVHARNVALGVGTEPHVPAPLRSLLDDPSTPVMHAADYLRNRERLLAADHITVVGAGQSGAEVLLDLLRHRPPLREGLTWVARTPAFAPMEYSKLGLEQFTPDYTRYFHQLPEDARDRLWPQQWQLYKGVSATTLGEIHDELYHRSFDGNWPDVTLTPGVAVTGARRRGRHLELHVEQRDQGARRELRTDAVVLATGYRKRPVDAVLAPLRPYLRTDTGHRPLVDATQRLVLDPAIGGSVFVQNFEDHTHGVGTPDLGLAAWRSAVIINALTGVETYPLPERTAFTSFGIGAIPVPEDADEYATTLNQNGDAQ
ncbi:lysine N(6)-hydroxylase/L-ornithine N(5)-oxygenase family protein [Nocardia inohanensis]|uniref:lysine N(6)-hydroxylase/L-ornithine N(5)-oxygenase family protein n=1 Tax=Nocardia inohanensis TaxID=209246 RepID=UPI000829712A|nr:SidA/IucD/PvdA family monooxygenase [Nocardia inohanensis]